MPRTDEGMIRSLAHHGPQPPHCPLPTAAFGLNGTETCGPWPHVSVPRLRVAVVYGSPAQVIDVRFDP